MIINKHDTNGTKPLLGKGELGYDDYIAGGDAGRVYVGTGSANIPQATKAEVVAVDGKVDTHVARVDNPHTVTKAQVGLGAVDNTADSSKVVASAGKWTTSRNITIGNSTKSVDGTGNVAWTLAEIGAIGPASPALTGVPTAPTAAVNTNTTQLATTAFVNTEIANDAVPRVASTDNAVVRFDGVTGAVQNSGVVIDDSNNVGIGTSSPIDGNLHINSATTSNIKFTNTTTGQTANDGLFVGIDSAGDAYVFNKEAKTLNLGTNNLHRMTIDSSGNIGIGVTPSAWYTGIQALEVGDYSSLYQGQGGEQNLESNSYRSAASTWVYKSSGNGASRYVNNFGQHVWQTAPSGTAGNAITWTNAMTLDANGNLLVGTASGSINTIAKNVATGSNVLNVVGNNYGTYFCAADAVGFNNTNTTIFVGKISSTNRSINAGGTINASGADYAEYEYSNDITILKGQIVGFKADGTLTDKYSESVRFAIKSTNPSIVGGDTWGIEDIVGKRPEQPVRKLDKTEQVKIEDSEEFETVVIEAGDTDAEWEAIEAKYKEDLADFEARLEVERQKVDRIAYAGKVPVNVYGATAGQYIVAIDKDGGIDGVAVNKADMTFAQYQDAVGRVNKILEDGRAEVAVIIH